MVLAIVLQAWLAQAGCTKDTDCKGDRICEAGVCVSPKAPPAPPGEVSTLPPPPPPPPAAAPPSRAPLATTPGAPPAPEPGPRVVRRDGLICVQAPGADGRLEESCRQENAEPVERPAQRRGRSVAPPAEDEPRGRFVMDVLLQSGALVLAAGGNTVGTWQLNGTLDVGGRLRSGIGFAGFASVLGTGNARGGIILATVGPALRLGDRSHFLLGTGATYLSAASTTGSVSGLAWSILAQGVFAIAGAFGLSLGGQLSFDASGVVFALSAGLAFGAF